jgi:ABC-type glycerol-3-phosphate transport system substrate-binding protein
MVSVSSCTSVGIKELTDVQNQGLSRRIHRRSLLAGLGTGAAALVAACSAAPATPTAAPAAPAAASTPQVVEKVVTSVVTQVVQQQVVITATPGPATATPQPAAAAAPAAPSKTEVTYMAWWWTEPNRKDAWRQQVSNFHNMQDKWRIKEKQVDFGNYGQVTLSQLASGGIDTDMMPTFPELTTRLTQGGAFIPLNDITDNLKLTPLIRPGVKDWVSWKGQIYGLDTVTVGLGPFYNQTHLQAKNLKVATTPQEFVDLNVALTDRSKNQFGFWNPVFLSEVGDSWLRLKEFALPFGGTWADGTKPLVTSDPVRQGLQFAKDLYDKAMPHDMNQADQATLFYSGHITQTIVQSPIIGGAKVTAPELFKDLRSAPVPWSSLKSIARQHPMHISAKSKYPDAGRDFFNMLFAPPAYVQFTIDCYDFIPQYPITKDTPGVTDDVIKNWQSYLTNTPQAQGYQTMLQTYVVDASLLGGFLNNNDEFGQIVVQYFEGVLRRGDKLDAAIANMDKDLKDLATRIQS